MTTIHESNGWQFKNSASGMKYRYEAWDEDEWVLATANALMAYAELCPLPPDPPTLEHEGVMWIRSKDGSWDNGAGYVPLGGLLTATLLDRIAKQGDYEDTE